MNLRQIEYIMAVLREGSITAASKRLYLSQPALSQAIKQVEADLGVAIFDRTTDPISLTYAGRRYVEAAQRILDIDRNLRTELAESAGEIHGHFRLGLSKQRGLQILPLVVPEFARRYPYVCLNLVEHGSDTLERLTAEGECDISLVTTNRKSNRLHYVLIESEEVVLMAAKDTVLARETPDGQAISISRAENEHFVCMSSGHSVRAIQDRLFDRYHLSPRVLMETDNMEVAKQVAALSGAVMLIPRVYVMQDKSLTGRVQCHPILDNDYERHFYFCYRKGMRLTQYMEDFIRIVCDKLQVPFSIPGEEETKPEIPTHHVRPNGE